MRRENKISRRRWLRRTSVRRNIDSEHHTLSSKEGLKSKDLRYGQAAVMTCDHFCLTLSFSHDCVSRDLATGNLKMIRSIINACLNLVREVLSTKSVFCYFSSQWTFSPQDDRTDFTYIATFRRSNDYEDNDSTLCKIEDDGDVKRTSHQESRSDVELITWNSSERLDFHSLHDFETRSKPSVSLSVNYFAYVVMLRNCGQVVQQDHVNVIHVCSSRLFASATPIQSLRETPRGIGRPPHQDVMTPTSALTAAASSLSLLTSRHATAQSRPGASSADSESM